MEKEKTGDTPNEEKQNRPVMTFVDYTKALEETVAMIDVASQQECHTYCLDRIQKEVGSFDINEILKVAVEIVTPAVKARMVTLYVREIVRDYMATQKGQLGIVDVGHGKDFKGSSVPKEVLERGLDLLCNNIADEVIVKITQMNDVNNEEAE